MNKDTLAGMLTWFEEKGMLKEEFSYFMEDVTRFIDERGSGSLDSLNEELETLGWGIRLLDETAYHHMMRLHTGQSHNTTDFDSDGDPQKVIEGVCFGENYDGFNSKNDVNTGGITHLWEAPG